MNTKAFPLMILAALLLLGWFYACGDDDDDDDDDEAAGDDTTGDDDVTNDDDSDNGQICLNGEVIDPLPNPGMQPDAVCTLCHADSGIASMAHEGQYDSGAPNTCMQVGCHGCPAGNDDDTANDDDDDTADDDDDLEDGPGGFDPNYRTSEDFFTMMDKLKPGDFNAQVQIWYSTNIQPIIEDDAFAVPVGTTSIQEVDSNADNVVDSLTIMVKKENGYDTPNNDWYYETRDPDGALRNFPAPGKIQVCIDCHKGFPDTDFLAGTDLR